jgi:TonB-linked SusC/RagA family outer membrane protein
MRLPAYHRLLYAVSMIFISLTTNKLKAADGITLHFENATLQKIFSAIEAQSKIRFVYTNEQLSDAKLVTITATNESLGDVLQKCFHDQPITYFLEDHYVIIRRITTDPEGDSREVRGAVKNDKGDPVAGATVSIQGSERATVTEADGNFILKQVKVGSTIIFSGANVETNKMVFKGQQSLNITLKAKVNKLEEIQVIAYGTTTKRLSTGAMNKITSEAVSQQPVTDPLAAMEAQAPGLDITQNTGVAGGSFTVRIRGQNSLQNGNEPLYIIDGVPFISTSLSNPGLSAVITGGGSPLSTLNPKDIESIEVLKDADATAIYGSRAANGVVMITTKSGKAGKTKIDLNISGGVGKVANSFKLLNTQQYLAMRHEAFANDGQTPDPYNAKDLLLWDTTRYTDWQKALIGQTSHILDANLAISGGSANTQYRLAGGYYRQSAVVPGSYDYQKISGAASITSSSADQKFKIQFNAVYNVEENNLPNIDPTANIFSLPPDAPPAYDSISKLNFANGYSQNPYQTFVRSYSSQTENLISDALISYQIIDGLVLKSNFGYSSTHMDEWQLLPLTSFDPAYGLSSGFTNTSTHLFNNWIVEPQLEYQKSIKSIKWNMLLGATFNQNMGQSTAISANGFPSDALLENLSAASSVTVTNNNSTLYRYNAFFGRLNINWRDEFLFNLTGRRDGSSRFGPANRFANFGAIGAAWVFSKQSFIRKALPIISFGKLRASFGTNGNDQIGDYGYLDIWQPTYNAYNGSSGLTPASLYNPNYKWETNQKLDIAIELGLAKDRLFFSIDYYHNITTNQLIGYPLSFVTGFSSIKDNSFAKLLNEGWEFELNGVLIKTERFTWSLSLNLTIPKNELLSYPNLAGSNYANAYEIGRSVYLPKLFHSTGVDPKTGVYTFLDVNKDGKITYPDDLTDYKTLEKNYYGGLGSSFQCGPWQLNFLFQFVQQSGRNYLYGYPDAPGAMTNQPTIVLNRWRQPGNITSIQQFTQDPGSAGYQAWFNASLLGDNTISNASFIRMKNISLSYHLPQKWMDKSHWQDIRIYVQGQNLFTISHYEGLDPETQSISVLPPLRTIVAGVQFIF